MSKLYTMIRVKKIHSGFSVLEVLISALILLILMSISSEIMYQSLRISREERGLAFIRKEAIKAINWLNNDLRRTNSASFSYKVVRYKCVSGNELFDKPGKCFERYRDYF
jgi:prepilin-type N-terminal cleavage/methylation domain-containing protein